MDNQVMGEQLALFVLPLRYVLPEEKEKKKKKATNRRKHDDDTAKKARIKLKKQKKDESGAVSNMSQEFKDKLLQLGYGEKPTANDEAMMTVPLRVYRETAEEEKNTKRNREAESGEKRGKEKRKAKRQKRIKELPEPVLDLPQEFKNKFQELGCFEEPVLVIQKELYSSDVSKHHNRFSIPAAKIRPGSYTAEEEEKLNDEKAIEVKLVDPCLRVSIQNLKKWMIRKSSQYVLIKNWHKEVVMKNPNTIKKGNVVQLWAARHEKQICLALVFVREGRK